MFGSLHVTLDDRTDRGEQGRHVAALNPAAAARIKNRLQLLVDKGDIATAPEHGGNHAREPQRPGIMFHILGIDENLERLLSAIFGQVVDGDIDGMRAVRPFQLVGRAGQAIFPGYKRGRM